MGDQNQNPKTPETQKKSEDGNFGQGISSDETTEVQKGQEDEERNLDGSNNTELDVCKKQTEEYLNNWKRERADFVNYKKDEGKRMEEFIKFANEALVLELLDTMDDLCLAAKDLKNQGLDQVIKKFVDLLKKYGVEKIKVGDKFDPMTQEVVGTTETRNESETQKEEERVEEIRTGYTMYGKVIRPARVKIIK